MKDLLALPTPSAIASPPGWTVELQSLQALHKQKNQQDTLLGALVAQFQKKRQQRSNNSNKSPKQKLEDELNALTKLNLQVPEESSKKTTLLNPLGSDTNNTSAANPRTLELLERAIASTIALKDLPNRPPNLSTPNRQHYSPKQQPHSPKQQKQTWKRPSQTKTLHTKKRQRVMTQPVPSKKGRLLMRTAAPPPVPLQRRSDNHTTKVVATKKRPLRKKNPTTKQQSPNTSNETKPTSVETQTTHKVGKVPSEKDIGVKVKKFFVNFGWFVGTIVAVDPKDNCWTIQYTDGDKEYYYESDIVQTLIDHAQDDKQPRYDLDTKVYKHFSNHGWFHGRIVSVGRDGYFCEYEDGDREEFFFGDVELDTIVQQAVDAAMG